MQRPHEMLHVEFVGPASSFAFLFGEPDLFFRNIGELPSGESARVEST
jgi:hypothetical protein